MAADRKEIYDAAVLCRQGQTDVGLPDHRTAECENHLADLGFSPQSLVVVKQEIAGNLIVEVKGCRMALDAGMARRIYVQEVPA